MSGDLIDDALTRFSFFFFFQAEDGIRDLALTGHRWAIYVCAKIQRECGHSGRNQALPARVAGSILHAQLHQFRGFRRYFASGRWKARSQLSPYTGTLRGRTSCLVDPARQGTGPAGCGEGDAGIARMFRFGWSFLLKTPSLKLERCEAWLAAEAFESAPGPSPSIRIRDPVVPSWIQGAAYFRIAVERLPPGAESRFSPRSAARICGKACRAATSPAATMSGVLVKSSHTNCLTSGSMMISACARQAKSACRCMILKERLRISVSVRGCSMFPDSRYTAMTMSAPSKSTPSMGTGAVRKRSEEHTSNSSHGY